MADQSGLSQEDLDLIEVHAAAAQAQAKAKADAEARTAEINAAAGINDAVDGGALKEGARGFGEGAVSLLDLPTRAAAFIRNAPALTTNAGIAAAKNATPEQLKARGVDPAIVNMQPEATVKSPDYDTSLYNTALPADPNHPEARKVGNIAGSVLPAIVAPELLAGKIPAIFPALADTAFTTATTYGGGKGGRLIDQSFGGSGDTREAVGEFVGGGMTPILSNVFSRATTDANSAARLADAKLAGVKQPDLSLVGNDFASRWGSKSNQAAQQAEIDTTLRNISAERRGEAAAGPIAKGDIGKGVVDLTTAGAKNIGKQAEADYTAGLPYDQNLPTRPANLDIPAEKTFERPTVNEFKQASDASRYDTSTGGPRLLDPNAHAGLEANVVLRQRELNRLNQARAAPEQINAATADLADAKNALDANYGTTSGDLKAQRGEVRQRLDAGVGPTHVLDQIKQAQTEAMRNDAISRGVTGEEFDAVNARYADAMTRKSELEKIARSKENPAYGSVFGPGGEQNVSTLQTLQSSGEDLSKILADNLELRTRGPVAAGQPELPRDVGLNARAPDWWDAAPEEVRRAYATTPGIRDRIDATMRTIRSDARRGGSQVEGPDIVGPTAAAAAVAGHPLAAAAAMTPRIGSALVGGIMRNPRFTEAMIARRANPLTPLDLARTISAYVGSQPSQQR